MSVIGSVGSPAAISAGPTTASSSRGAEFASRLDDSLGTGRSHQGHRHAQATAQNGAATQAGSTTGSMAQTAASLFGDVFGALGASTGTNASARTATDAYRRAA